MINEYHINDSSGNVSCVCLCNACAQADGLNLSKTPVSDGIVCDNCGIDHLGALKRFFERAPGTRIIVDRTWIEFNKDETWSVYKAGPTTQSLQCQTLLSQGDFFDALNILWGDIHKCA